MTTAVIPNLPVFSFLDNNGHKASGYKLYTYLAGTTTNATTWQDQGLSVANENPITLDSRGEAVIWLDSTKEYKFVLKTPAGATVRTYDDVSGGISGADFASTADGLGISLVGNAIQRVANIAALRSIAVTTSRDIETQGYYAAGDGGHGTYYGATGAAAGTYVDNGGSIIVPTGGDGSSAWMLKADQVSAEQFGAKGDGTTDDSTALAAMFAAHSRVRFTSGKTYRMTAGVTKASDDIDVDFGNSVIKCDFSAGGNAFTFGAASNTPANYRLKIRGGCFTLADPATVQNVCYIIVRGIKGFVIRDSYLKNVGNGGIQVQVGSEDGLIDSVVIDGASGYSTIRGIWLNGSGASDYASQLVNLSSITRNATAVPAYAVKNVEVRGCRVTVPFYGIYLMNTRDCKVIDNHVDISGAGAARCIAVNNYSPRTLVMGNTLKSDRSSTGILVTQYSHDVVINGNHFIGDFGGNRDIYVQYLAEALIEGNRFVTDSTQRIEIDMGGYAVIRGNWFGVYTSYAANERVVSIRTIGASDPANTGDTATTLPGLLFVGNVVKDICTGVVITTPTSTGGNIPGLDHVVVRDSYFYGYNNASGAGEYLLNASALGSTYIVRFSLVGNTVFPADKANRNNYTVSGTGYEVVRFDAQRSTYLITNAAGGGTITSSKNDGGYMACSVSRSVNDALLTPRTINGNAGASVPRVVSVIPVTNTIYDWKVYASGSSYGVKLYDSAGAQIALSTTAASFYVVLEAANT